MIDSVIRTGSNYHPRVFLEECKYIVKVKNMPKYIIDETEISSGSDEKNSSEENSSEENSSEEKSDEENSDKKSSDKETSNKES